MTEFLAQITLYKMLKLDFQAYERTFQIFNKLQNDHLQGKPPIPPNCRVLILHLFLLDSNSNIASMKLSTLTNDPAALQQCYDEAKRRLQMCSNQVLDPKTLTTMKNNLTRSFYLITGKLEKAKNQL